jgi:hypothetical protein
MDVCPVGFPNVIGESLPAVFVQFGQVGLVFRVDHVDRISAKDNHVWHQMPKGPVRWVRPFDWEYGLSTPTNANYSTVEGGLSSDERLDIVLPELFERKRPGNPVHLASAA